MVNVECRRAGIGCLDCKKILADNMLKELDPIREKYHDLQNRPDDVWNILESGAARSREIARSE